MLSDGFAANSSTRQLVSIEFLGRLAQEVNVLAHQLKGNQRRVAFQIKAGILSAALIADNDDAIRIDGTKDGGILGLDIRSNPRPVRLHIPLWELHPEAKRIARLRAASAPTVASLSQLLRAKRVQEPVSESNAASGS